MGRHFRRNLQAEYASAGHWIAGQVVLADARALIPGIHWKSCAHIVGRNIEPPQYCLKMPRTTCPLHWQHMGKCRRNLDRASNRHIWCHRPAGECFRGRCHPPWPNPQPLQTDPAAGVTSHEANHPRSRSSSSGFGDPRAGTCRPRHRFHQRTAHLRGSTARRTTTPGSGRSLASGSTTAFDLVGAARRTVPSVCGGALSPNLTERGCHVFRSASAFVATAGAYSLPAAGIDAAYPPHPRCADGGVWPGRSTDRRISRNGCELTNL